MMVDNDTNSAVIAIECQAHTIQYVHMNGL